MVATNTIAWPVSVENRAYAFRGDHLRLVPAEVRFLVMEPLLEDVGEVNLDGIGWVVVGGESGPRARPMEAGWVRSVRDQCLAAGVPFFFKQWGGRTPRVSGRELDGQLWSQRPASP